MARRYYPLALDIEGKRCLVVGGGKIAAEKVEGLLAAGAEMVVVSPDVLPRVAELAAERRIEYHARAYTTGDLDDVYLAYGATDDLEVNARITEEARTRRILVNAVDDPPNCDFFAMAIVRRGDLQIAISTNGHSPAFARWLREDLEKQFSEEYGELLAILSDVRRKVQAQGKIPPYEHWEEALSADVLRRIREGNGEAVRAQIWGVISRAQVDSGPGPARWEKTA